MFSPILNKFRTENDPDDIRSYNHGENITLVFFLSLNFSKNIKRLVESLLRKIFLFHDSRFEKFHSAVKYFMVRNLQ